MQRDRYYSSIFTIQSGILNFFSYHRAKHITYSLILLIFEIMNDLLIIFIKKKGNIEEIKIFTNCFLFSNIFRQVFYFSNTIVTDRNCISKIGIFTYNTQRREN